MANTSILLDKYEFTPDAEDIILEIEGQPGIVMFTILDLLNVDPTVTLIVTRNHLRFRYVGLGGLTTITCPLDTVTGVYGGLEKPKWALYLAATMLILTVTTLLSNFILTFIYILIGIAAFAYFWIKKGFVIGFSTSDFVNLSGLMFDAEKPEGGDITEEELLTIIKYINLVLLKAHTNPTGDNPDVPDMPSKPEAMPMNFNTDGDDNQFAGSVIPAQSDNLIGDFSGLSIGALFGMARTQYRDKNFDEVLEITNEILDRNPDHLKTLRMRSLAHKELGDMDLALVDRKRYKKLGGK